VSGEGRGRRGRDGLGEAARRKKKLVERDVMARIVGELTPSDG
jgi:hypothetical protein